jgi:integrase
MEAKKERMPIRLVKAAVEELVPEAGAYFVSVTNAKGQAVQGLNLRVLPSGVKVWVHRYRFRGLQKACTLGRYPSMTPELAEKASRATQARIDAGTDPNQAKAEAKKAAQEAKRAAVTVEDLAKRFKEEHIQPGPRAQGKEAVRLIDKHILPALGKLPLAAVGPADVSNLLFRMRATPVQANRARGVLRTMFNRAEEWELRPLGTNPVVVVKVRNPETKRERRLSDLELKALGKAMREADEAPEVLVGLRLALLAGMRKGEVLGLRWEWMDLDAAEIRIPPEEHKGGRKTGKVRVVRLCSALVADLRGLTPTLGCPFMIPGHQVLDEEGRPVRDQAGRTVWKPFTALQNPWERIREAAGLSKAGEPDEDDPGLHDLRRTFASVGADLGLKGFVGELLGHAEQTVTDIYTRAAAERLHEAAETIGARIAGILAGVIDPEKEAEERRQEKDRKAKGAS